MVAVSSGPYLSRLAKGTSKSSEADAVIAANTSVGGAPEATKVAVRRSVCCSATTRSSSRRASVLAMAVATSSAKSTTRDSLPSAISTAIVLAKIVPHTRLSTKIGAATVERGQGPERARIVHERPGERFVVIDEDRATGLANCRRDVVPVQTDSRAGGNFRFFGAPVCNDGHRAIGLEPPDGAPVGHEDPSDLLGHGREDLIRCSVVRHERRDPPQRRLLGRERAQITLCSLDVSQIA